MKIMLGIGYVSRPDLLFQALASVKSLWPQTFIVDNSGKRELNQFPELSSMVTIIEPPVPLTYAQTMNLFRKKVLNEGYDALLSMHTDAVANPGTPEALMMVLQMLHDQKRKWGLVFTRAVGTIADYDYFMAYSAHALRDTGTWDPYFQQYYADTDYYWRIHLAGYEHVRTGLPVFHHGSTTHKSDPYRAAINGVIFPLTDYYYRLKWGDTWFEEKYAAPFTAGPFPHVKPFGWVFPAYG